MSISAIYPGTFDPITYGHADIIARAAGKFDQVIVAVHASEAKKPLFSVDERVALAQLVIEELDNVQVCAFDGLLVSFAKQKKANVILRGLRNVSDLDYELQNASMNHRMNSQIETLFLPPRGIYAHISSTLVREVARHNGDLSHFVPPAVIKALQDKTK